MERKIDGPRFRSVSLNADLFGAVEDFIRQKGTRYRSVADFVSEATRLRLEQLEKLALEMAVHAQ